jgi:hypothetical protein
MSKSIDFTKLKKKYLTVTLADDENTVLQITTPTKDILDDFLSLKDTVTGEDVGEEAIDALYEICAKIMSRNRAGKVISTKFVQETLDFEDLIIFITGYSEFISEVANSKN